MIQSIRFNIYLSNHFLRSDYSPLQRLKVKLINSFSKIYDMVLISDFAVCLQKWSKIAAQRKLICEINIIIFVSDLANSITEDQNLSTNRYNIQHFFIGQRAKKPLHRAKSLEGAGRKSVKSAVFLVYIYCFKLTSLNNSYSC